MSTASPGWYPDPSNPLQERLWDGDEWVDRTRPRSPQQTPSAPEVSPAAHTVVVEPERATFGRSVREGFARYADFDGRSSVGAYWNFWFFSVLVSGGSVFVLGELSVIVLAALLFPSLAFAVRRLHDRGKSGAFLFINVIPVIGTLVCLFELASAGDQDANRYGMPPGATGLSRPDQSVARPGLAGSGRTLGPAGGVILYDTGIPGDPNRYLEVAPAGWHRTPADPAGWWEFAVSLVEQDPSAVAAGWRLPTESELEWFRKQRHAIPGLSRDLYWSGTRNPHYRWATAIDLTFMASGSVKQIRWKNRCRIRPVRNLASLS